MKYLYNSKRLERWLGLALLLAAVRPSLAQTLPPAWPDQPLAVTACSPAQALAGTRVVLSGQGFAGVSSVCFNGIEAAEFEVNSLTQLTATVPTLASSGPVSVSTAAGTARTAQPLEVPPEVVVQGAQSLRGTYARLVVGAAGVATLGGPVAVLGTLVVQRGGQLNLGGHVLTGGGFVLSDGSTLSLSHPAGLAAIGSSGSVQTTTRTFSPEASYVYYNLPPGSQTGPGLPARVRGLAVVASLGRRNSLTLSNDLAISQVLRLEATLITDGHALTLLATPDLGPALLLGPGAVQGPVYTQRAGEDGPATSLPATAAGLAAQP